MRREFLLDAGDCSCFGRRNLAAGMRTGGNRQPCLLRLDEFFRGPDAEPLLDHPAGKDGPLRGILDAEEHLGVPDGEQRLGEVALQFPIQLQQSEGIRHGGSPLSNAFRRLLLREVEIADQTGVAIRLFDRVEALALQILDETERSRGRVARVNDAGWDGLELEKLEGAPATFAGDQLELAGV